MQLILDREIHLRGNQFSRTFDSFLGTLAIVSDQKVDS
jgi:hypothetical protein